MAEQYANDATTTLASDLHANSTTLNVVSSVGFPSSGSFRLRIDQEILLVTSVSGNVWTVQRAVEPVSGVQTAAFHSTGATVACVLTVASIVPTGRTISAGTGLTGGGDLTSDETLSVSYGTTAGTSCQGNDSRLSDSRTPTGSAGGDLAGTYPSPTLTTTSVVAGAYGDSSHVGVFTVDSKGRLTAASATTIASLAASVITTGQLSAARGGTGVDGSAAGNGKLLIGNGSGFTLANLTAGSNITITNSAGSITIAASGGGGGPGGSNTQVQFNDGGSAFGGNSGLVYDKTNQTLTVTAAGSGDAVQASALPGDSGGNAGVFTLAGTALSAVLCTHSLFAAAQFSDGVRYVNLCQGGTYAGYFTDGTRVVAICDTVNAILVTGGHVAVTTGNGDVAITGTSPSAGIGGIFSSGGKSANLGDAAHGYAGYFTDGTLTVQIADGTYAVNATVGAINSASGYYAGGTSPAPDGTYSNPTSITIKGGIITAIS